MRCMECDRPSLNPLEFLGKNVLPLVYTALQIQEVFEQFAMQHNAGLHDSVICCIFSCGAYEQTLF